MRLAFDQFELDTDRFELRRNGATVALEPQAFDVLAYLVTHRDRVVSRQELLEAVWGTTFVSDSAVATRIKEARHAIGDDGDGQRLIRTLLRRGYRFVGEASPTDAPERPAAAPVSTGALGPQVSQQIRFCATGDGVRIAYATSGAGPPFVKAANWLTNLEFDLKSPVWRHLITDLVPERQFVRYDQRGCGLSDWEVEEFTLEAWTRDLETVVDALGLERFPLLGISQGSAVAISFAVRHPERVSHLILNGAYARGRNRRGTGGRAEAEALQTLTEQGWGKSGAFAQMFSARLIPDGSPEQVRWLTDLQRVSTSTGNAVRFRAAFSDFDVQDVLPQVRVPTLVLHARGDQAAPFEEGRLLAASIPNARLVPLESDNHLILADEPAWGTFRAEIASFLAAEVPA